LTRSSSYGSNAIPLSSLVNGHWAKRPCAIEPTPTSSAQAEDGPARRRKIAIEREREQFCSSDPGHDSLQRPDSFPWNLNRSTENVTGRFQRRIDWGARHLPGVAQESTTIQGGRSTPYDSGLAGGGLRVRPAKSSIKRADEGLQEFSAPKSAHQFIHQDFTLFSYMSRLDEGSPPLLHTRAPSPRLARNSHRPPRHRGSGPPRGIGRLHGRTDVNSGNPSPAPAMHPLLQESA